MRLALFVVQLLRQLRHLLKEIANKPDICNLEYRRIGVFIDGGNDLAVLHTSEVLDGA